MLRGAKRDGRLDARPTDHRAAKYTGASGCRMADTAGLQANSRRRKTRSLLAGPSQLKAPLALGRGFLYTLLVFLKT